MSSNSIFIQTCLIEFFFLNKRAGPLRENRAWLANHNSTQCKNALMCFRNRMTNQTHVQLKIKGGEWGRQAIVEQKKWNFRVYIHTQNIYTCRIH
jgi:hypothetical protein